MGMRSRSVSLFVLLAALFVAAVFAPLAAQAAFPGRNGNILFTEGWHVKLLNPKTGTIHKVVNGGGPYTAQFLANGRNFVYINGNANELRIRSLSDRNIRRRGRLVLRDPELGLRAVSSDADGRHIVFAAVRGGYQPRKGLEHRIEIYSINRDGSNLTRLTRNRAFDNDPAVSPDGSKVAFVRRKKGGARIFTMNIDGSGQRQVSHGSGWKRSPSYSPDGRRIVYAGQLKRPGLDRWESAEIFSISARDGSGRIRITNDRGEAQYPSFSPNGKKVLFVRHWNQLMSVNVDRTGLNKLYETPYGGVVLWTNGGPAAN